MQITNLELPDYRISTLIYRDGVRVAYRATRKQDGSHVAIETLDAKYPDRQQIAYIKRDMHISKRLSDLEGVRQVYELVPHGSGNLALVTESFSGSLRTRLTQVGGQGLVLDEMLGFAIDLARSVGGVHARGVVHKAICPENILFDSVNNKLVLTGFGIASELDQERQAIQASGRLAGPLPYISPEQTGRMNRDLDYRSDYYSLGVVFFEMLTGRVPFRADQQLEWVHSHISQLPLLAHEMCPDIPETVSLIVSKLLAKNPDDRYQSTEGLIFDLEKCLNLLNGGGDVTLQELGGADSVQKFLLPQTLYGREQKIAELLTLFDSAIKGSSEFCLVHGHSGVGKSALVNEIDRPLVRERGFLVQGKFDQLHHGKAYTAIVSTLRGLVQQILGESQIRLLKWREQLLHALQAHAGLVIELVPELELVIGSQPDVPDLPPAEARNRLHMVLIAFLKVFANQSHPVVMFVDDLQWCDSPSLELIKRIVSSSELSHFLLIGAYRSNEVGAGHPVRLMLDEIRVDREITELPIGGLDRLSINNLVADALRKEPEEVVVLSDLLYEKAQGNPFFTNELLRQLHQKNVIAFDPFSSSWEWDLDAVKWAEVSNDVVEFMVSSLRLMPQATQKVLQLAACIGSRFDLKTLATIYEKNAFETAAALLPALKQHAIIPLDNDYRFVNGLQQDDDLEVNPIYRFQHDRVQQAAYALINVDMIPAVHLSIGRLMLEHIEGAVPDEQLIDIVDHLNSGYKFLQVEQECLQLSELNLRAGIQAKKSSAYEAALGYLRVAAEVLPDPAWEYAPEMMKALTHETQQCAYLTGRDDEADRLIDVLLMHVENDLERAELLSIRTRQYATLGRMEDSILSAIEGLKLLGIEFTDQPSQKHIEVERKKVTAYLGERNIADLVNAEPLMDAEKLAAMRLLMEIFAAAFLSASGNLFPYLVLKAVNLSLKHGNCPESAFAYAAYGMVLCGEFDEPAKGFEYAKAGLEINEQHDDLMLRARVIYVYAMFVHHWNQHWATLTPWFLKGIEAGYQSGDLLYLAYSAQDCVIWDPGLDLETAHRKHSENLEIVRQCAYQDSLDSGTLFLQLQRNLMGLTEGPYSLNDESFDIESCLEGMRQRQFMTGLANYHIYSAEICLLHGDIEMAMGHVLEQDKLFKSAMSLPQLVRFYIVSFLIRAIRYKGLSFSEQGIVKERLQKDLNRMQMWADNCEENFRHLQYLMEAELHRIEGRNLEAMQAYDIAINAAQRSGFLRDEAMACERAARLLQKLGRSIASEGYLRGAYKMYERWGARRKTSMLKSEFPVLLEMVEQSRATGSDLDILSVMKASRAISREMVLERLLNTTLNIMLENAGGQWGCLLAREEGQLRIEAVHMPDDRSAWAKIPEHLFVEGLDKQFPLPLSLISEVLRNDSAVVLRNAAEEGLFTQDPYIKALTPYSVLCVPIRRERFDGVLYMENNLTYGAFTEDRVEVIRLLAAQTLVAIENARLYEKVQNYTKTLEDKVAERTAKLEQVNLELQGLAERDGLTGVFNRRRGDSYLNDTWARLLREKQPLTVIMLDVDHFKAYNDTYGHQAGDDCLIAVAKVMDTIVSRPADMIARYGGEEFMLILPNTELEGAAYVAEKIRHAIECEKIEHTQSSTDKIVTASFGVASILPAEGKQLDNLIRETDMALYRAKEMGRNQVLVAPEVL